MNQYFKAKAFLIASIFLTFGCNTIDNSKPRKTEYNQIENFVLDTAFLQYPCAYAPFELTNLYDELQEIKNEKEEFSVVFDSLKSKGFTLVKIERGNWEKGPRIVCFYATNNHCDCRIDKLYYTIKENQNKYRVTERITCTENQLPK